jgi:hypothetical protein
MEGQHQRHRGHHGHRQARVAALRTLEALGRSSGSRKKSRMTPEWVNEGFTQIQNRRSADRACGAMSTSPWRPRTARTRKAAFGAHASFSDMTLPDGTVLHTPPRTGGAPPEPCDLSVTPTRCGAFLSATVCLLSRRHPRINPDRSQMKRRLLTTSFTRARRYRASAGLRR